MLQACSTYNKIRVVIVYVQQSRRGSDYEMTCKGVSFENRRPCGLIGEHILLWQLYIPIFIPSVYLRDSDIKPRSSDNIREGHPLAATSFEGEKQSRHHP